MTVARPKSHRLLSAAAVAVAAGVCLASGFSAPARAAASSELSVAEKLVFTENQLGALKTPTTLHYSYVKTGEMEPGFQDDVRIDVERGPKACCVVHAKFLSGPREQRLPEIEEAVANPVTLFFLERDIHEMERLTKGKSGYFRKRIRMTMVDEATVRDTKVRYAGKELPAKEVSLSPYVNDPLRSRFERYADKRYTFVLASGVPGGVYQIKTSLPGAQPSDAPALEETMTLAEPAPTNKP